MLGLEALRLLRERWRNPTMLAEELYVLLSAPDIPITTSAPIRFTAPPGGANQPMIQFSGFPAAAPLIQINRPNGQPIVISGNGINLGGATITGQGIAFPPIGTINLDGLPNAFGPIPGTGGRGGGSGGSGGSGSAPASASAFPGVVVSGSGNTYVMTVYPGGLSGPPQTVTVTQLQIDPAETIPPGSWGVVSLAGNNYYAQFAVWL